MSLEAYLVPTNSENGKRIRLHVAFAYVEWDSFFYDEMGVHRPKPYVNGEDMVLRDRAELNQFEMLKQFPMLARIHDYYVDSKYDVGEVRALLAECESVETRVLQLNALTFVKGLIKACRIAIKHHAGLMLLCD